MSRIENEFLAEESGMDESLVYNSFPQTQTTQFSTLEYILIDIANHAGFDKLSYQDRLAKAYEMIESLQDGSITIQDLMDKCDESPFELQNAIQAYLKKDLNHVVGLDAVNQALQLYGVVTADLSTSSLASLGINARTDAYQLLADELNTSIGTNIFNRNNCKKALMITLYGSTVAYTKVLEALKLNDQLELAKLIGIEQDVHDDWFEAEFEKAMKEIAPKAMEAMEVLQELNDPEVGTYYWTMPDGFKVKYDVKSTQTVELKATSRGGVNFTYSASHKVYAPSKFNRGMSPNIIHSIDGYVAREMVRRMDGKFISTIHDQFNCKAVDCALMQQNYLDIMCELLESNILNDIIKQINPNARLVEKSNTLIKEQIQRSSYAIS